MINDGFKHTEGLDREKEMKLVEERCLDDANRLKNNIKGLAISESAFY